MSESEKIIYAAMVGLLIWSIQKIIAYIVIRRRITQSILTDIKLYLAQIKEAKDYLTKYEEHKLIQGQKIEYVDKFYKNNSSFYNSQLNELPKYYRRKTLDKLAKFYYSFWELQTLIEGLVAYLSHLYKSNIILSVLEIDRAKKKISRIIKLMDVILDNKVTKISDLIENYEGRQTPEAMI